MNKRKAIVKRKTNETEIMIMLGIDGKGRYNIDGKINFLNHMLELFAKHGFFDLEISAKGDLKVDQHHLVEDIGIVLGQAFKKALGDKKGINRAGYFVFPMQESLAIVAVDISGRPYLKFEAGFTKLKIGDLDSELIEEFFNGFAANLGANLHIKMPYGKNEHHKAESIFKAFGKAMSMACSRNPRIKSIPSTKGAL